MKRVASILLFAVIALHAVAQTAEIEALQKQRQALQEDISNTNRLYLDVKKHTTTILDRINLINKQIASRKELINVQRREIEALRQEERRLEGEIDRLNRELKQKQDNYVNAIRGMLNQKFNQNKLLFILSGQSIGESLRRMQYLREYSKWQKEQAAEIKRQNEEITKKREALIQAKLDKEKALASLQTEQSKLQGEEKARQSEVQEARGQERQLQRTLREKQQQASQLNRQIERLIAEEVARQEREAEARRRAEKGEELAEAETRAKEEAATDRAEPGPRIEAGASTTSDESFNLSKNFAANKGRLPMPVTGTATIVGNFGVKRHDEWNITTNSNGVDIQAHQGASIRSVFEGEVSKVFSFPGSNTCVIVRHGDYYTFYANIYDLFVKQGDKVKTGQSLGSIYSDPDTGIASMHFQLWQKTTKLDPAPWLQR
ncbi:MAG: peptidoglycan DD-metalloendopeptidase family protein [Bacteroidota bacterium]|jgi:septal ring factor EnvC (AmiA/AmiB activator)|nr:peptidoglycan DD-metalloendopeptidase family protein [Bacteroidota bacterium]HHU96553.1 peptidoglycan DD-metalloendopeptidase family protein [Petrimonas sp.]